jgi:hypothetical protein
MPSIPKPSRGWNALATSEDIKRIIGNLDETKLMHILSLRPTVKDVEEALMWLSGDRDVFGAGEPLKQVAGAIVAALTADQDEQESRSR